MLLASGKTVQISDTVNLPQYFYHYDSSGRSQVLLNLSTSKSRFSYLGGLAVLGQLGVAKFRGQITLECFATFQFLAEDDFFLFDFFCQIETEFSFYRSDLTPLLA